jgi:hypothetical protein
MIRRLFLDIETSPCIGSFWRPGYNLRLTNDNIEIQARIITAAYKWQGDPEVRTLAWKGPTLRESDKHIIEEIVPIMNASDEIVAHYGDGFDVPWIRTRALYHGIVTGIWKTVDTHAWAKKHFLLPTNKLDDIAKYLEIGSKLHTEYELWRLITFHADKMSLDKMVEYNKHDVELLEKVWEKLQAYAPPPTHLGVHEGREKFTCPECGGEPKKRQRPMTSTTGTVKHQMYCHICPRYYVISNTAYQAWIQ